MKTCPVCQNPGHHPHLLCCIRGNGHPSPGAELIWTLPVLSWERCSSLSLMHIPSDWTSTSCPPSLRCRQSRNSVLHFQHTDCLGKSGQTMVHPLLANSSSRSCPTTTLYMLLLPRITLQAMAWQNVQFKLLRMVLSGHQEQLFRRNCPSSCLHIAS